jgi:regulator of cell morphogenesis and NO signaling
MTTETLLRFRDRKVGDIAVALPGATAAFRKRKIDFCCNGDVALADAAARKGVDLAEIEAELARLDQAASADHPEETGELIAYVITRFHETHRRELPELIRLARRVEAVHGDRAEVPAGLADHLTAMLEELEAHMEKEEFRLFPMMLQGGCSIIRAPLQVMRADHDAIGEQLETLERLARGYAPPDGACRSWRALYAGCAKFDEDLRLHTAIENNVLFPRFGG